MIPVVVFMTCENVLAKNDLSSLLSALAYTITRRAQTASYSPLVQIQANYFIALSVVPATHAKCTCTWQVTTHKMIAWVYTTVTLEVHVQGFIMLHFSLLLKSLFFQCGIGNNHLLYNRNRLAPNTRENRSGEYKIIFICVWSCMAKTQCACSHTTW